MDVPAPLLLSPLRSVLAVAASPADLVCGLGGLLAGMASSGLQVRVACWSPEAGLPAAAKELAASEVVTVPVDSRGGEELEDAIAGLIADSDAVLVVGVADQEAGEGPRLVNESASAAAARKGRLLIEWLGQHDSSPHLPPYGPAGAAGSDLVTLAVDRSRQRRATARLSEPPSSWLASMAAAGGHERVRVRHAPYRPRLTRLRERLGPLLRPDATAGERREALHVLVAFARGGDWPDELLRANPEGEPASHGLCEEPRWSLTSLVFRAGQATPPHRHESWGAAATIVGVERNLRFAGWPESPRFVDEQISPVGGGYLFEPELCHQAMDGSGDLTVSLHLLVRRMATVQVK